MKMNISIILLSCVCSTLAITVHYDTTGSAPKNSKENQPALKDIRLVQIDQSDTLQKPMPVNRKEQDELKSVIRTRAEVKANRKPPQIKPRGDKKKPAVERVGTTKQTIPVDENQKVYMQKVANQLFMAQKHASVLSDYQKFILNQDQNVRNFVLGQSVQERNPKPFSRKPVARALTPTAKQEPITAENGLLQKIVVVTPKFQTTVLKKSQQRNDNTAQATHVKYVTLAPHSLASHSLGHYVEPQVVPQKVTFVPYHTPQPYTYYDLAVTAKPQIETVQIPKTISLGLGSYESPQYYKDESGREDSLHHEDTKYEFMYKVKDHEKNSNFGHKESRSEKATFGYYYVHLPDGRLETVKYWADKTGYHAKVDYQGEAKHPVHTEHKIHSHNYVHH